MAFVYACNYADQPDGAAIYAIYIRQGRLYRGIDVGQQAGIARGQNIGGTVRDQSIINQKEHVPQSVSSRQIIGWYTVTNTNPNRLDAWFDQPHWRGNRFDREVINEAEAAIRRAVNRKYPNGLSHARRATDIGTLAGPQPGVGF